ncbi:hypothetical protein EDB86DRAFT_3083371 [Lactarius hatsudake]|nr:hypothetical protein EDB86DRAFT_3083371 [Lactarius hatsudake]
MASPYADTALETMLMSRFGAAMHYLHFVCCHYRHKMEAPNLIDPPLSLAPGQAQTRSIDECLFQPEHATRSFVGQYPDTFTAVVLRNLVISSQPSSTDIPDWYFSEFGASPIVRAAPHVRNVRAPVLLLLGTEDRRVVNVQGKAFFHALRALGREVELLAFEGEGYALDGAEATRVGWEATADWFGRKA